MIKELDAEVPINREYPVTDFVHLMEHRALVGRQAQRNYWTGMWHILATCDRRHGD